MPATITIRMMPRTNSYWFMSGRSLASGSVDAVVAQALDLVGEVDALVGHDPLEDPHPPLQPFGMGGILRRPLGRVAGLGVELLLLHPQPPAPHACGDRCERDQHPDRCRIENGHFWFL